MHVHVVEHPLVNQKLTELRDVTTSSVDFRRLVHELGLLIGAESTAHMNMQSVRVTTPLNATDGVALAEPYPLVVPILRAGLGLLDAMLELVPSADVGFLGIKRDEATLQPMTYAERLPTDLTGRHVFIIDPMLATGGSLVAAIEFLRARNAAHISCVCILASPQGVATVTENVSFTNVDLHVGVIDEGLNDQGYIVPGLGDAGDRLYGSTD